MRICVNNASTCTHKVHVHMCKRACVPTSADSHICHAAHVINAQRTWHFEAKDMKTHHEKSVLFFSKSCGNAHHHLLIRLLRALDESPQALHVGCQAILFVLDLLLLLRQFLFLRHTRADNKKHARLRCSDRTCLSFGHGFPKRDYACIPDCAFSYTFSFFSSFLASSFFKSSSQPSRRLSAISASARHSLQASARTSICSFTFWFSSSSSLSICSFSVSI
jgi:hypothetical protein